MGPEHLRPRQRDGERPRIKFAGTVHVHDVLHVTSCSSSSQFMEDEKFVDTVKGFSTIRKEHTMFTDTNL